MGAMLDDDGDGEDDCAIADDLVMRFDRVLLYFQILTCAMNDNDLAVYLFHRHNAFGSFECDCNANYTLHLPTSG